MRIAPGIAFDQRHRLVEFVAAAADAVGDQVTGQACKVRVRREQALDLFQIVGCGDEIIVEEQDDIGTAGEKIERVIALAA